MGRVVLLVAAVAVSGCGESEPERRFLALPSESFVFSVLISVDAAGQALETLEHPESRATEIMESSASELVFVGVSEAALLAAIPDFDASRISETTLGGLGGASVLSCERGVRSVDGRYRETPIPSTAAIFRAPLDGTRGFEPSSRAEAPVVDELSLRLPSDPEPCAMPELVPFGAEPQILTERPEGIAAERWARSAHLFRSLIDVARIDDTLALVQAVGGVFLVERGQGILQEPEASFDVVSHTASFGEAIQGSNAHAFSFERNGRRALVAVTVSETPPRSRLMELAVSPRSLELLGSQLVEAKIYSALLEEGGSSILVGEAGSQFGVLFSRTSSLAAYVVRPLQGSPRRVVATGLSGAPHFVTTNEGFFYLGDGHAAEWSTLQLEHPNHGQVPRMLGAVTRETGGEREIWSGGNDGWLIRSPLRRALRFEGGLVVTPPSHQGCSTGSNGCGETNSQSMFRDLAAGRVGSEDGERLFMAETDCTSLLALRPADGCVASLSREGLPHAESSRETQLEALDAHGGWLTAVGTSGFMHELEL